MSNDTGLFITLILVLFLTLGSLIIGFVIPAITAPKELRSASRKTLLISMVIGTLYAGLCHLMARFEPFQDSFQVVTLGFVFLLPFVVGCVTVALATEEQQRSWVFRIFAPLGTAMLTLLCSLLTGWEGAICLIVGGFKILFGWRQSFNTWSFYCCQKE